MEYLLGVIFPYTAFVVFVSGTVLRIAGWLKTPVPFHLTLFPAPASTLGKITTIATDFLLCSSLFREDKVLWIRVWLFHMSLLLVIAGHVAGIFFLRNQFVPIGLSPSASQILSKLLGGMTGIVMVLSLAALLIGRIINPVVRKLSAHEDFFNLYLLLAIAVTGMLMYIPGFHADLPAVRSHMGGLINIRPTSLPQSPMFVFHFLLVNILLLYFPFSRLLHSVGYFVNRAMLTEAPPIYPTPAGIATRSSFAGSRAHSDHNVSIKEPRNIGARQP